VRLYQFKIILVLRNVVLMRLILIIRKPC